MKINKALPGICLMLVSFTIYSQSPADKIEIQKRSNVAGLILKSKVLKTESERNLQKALRYARLRNWPLRKKMENGNTGYLIGITENLTPMYAQTLNAGAAATSRADRLYSGGGLGLSVHGEDMIAGVWDNGRAKPDHQSLTGRISVGDPSTNTTDANHATHVTGTIIGADIPAQKLARGMAFLASVDDYDWYDDEAEMAAAAGNSLLISNHSYTFLNEYPIYSYRSFNIDEIAFDAPFYLPVFACGNTTATNYSVTGESVSKNVIAVASTLEVRSYTGPSSVIGSSGSSYGPSSDFRVKPDISAKGSAVYSSTITSTTSYGLAYGTSMASASVTGTLLLLQQHYHDVNSSYMLAATLKGLALHTADEAGSNPGPDIVFGWGLINAEFAANTITHNHKSAIIREDAISNHDTKTVTVISSGTGPLQVSICWTDRAPEDYSSSTASKLVNDLDVRVSDGTTTYYPWKINQSNITGAALNNGDNDRDNFERIDISSPGFGTEYTITITHKGDLFDELDQDFSLVVTGITSCDLNDPTLTITSPITSSIDHEGYGLITASSSISDGITVNFKAVANVLNPGFVVSRGGSSGYFLATAGPCEDESNPLRTIKKEEETVKDPVPVPAAKSLTGVSVECIPNPSRGTFKVFVNNIKEGLLQIIDISGKPVYENNFKNRNVIDINVDNLAKGFYFVKVTTPNGAIIKKIIIE